LSRLAWFDRAGKELAAVAPPAAYVNAELSPDDKFVAYDTGAGPLGDVWVRDIARGVSTRLTVNPANDGLPLWSPDGSTIAFRTDRDGVGNLYTRRVGVVADDQPLLKTRATKTPWDWSRDGRFLAFSSAGDVWAVRVDRDRAPWQVTSAPSNEQNAKISPDARWIAYQSDESGSDQIWVQSFPENGVKMQVSTAGGGVPRWSRDGRELFYISADQMMTAVRIGASLGTLEMSVPVPLFKAPASFQTGRVYTVARDGRFLFRVAVRDDTRTPITVILNWARLLDTSANGQ
jgi:Tol biopolymer transport system component